MTDPLSSAGVTGSEAIAVSDGSGSAGLWVAGMVWLVVYLIS